MSIMSMQASGICPFQCENYPLSSSDNVKFSSDYVARISQEFDKTRDFISGMKQFGIDQFDELSFVIQLTESHRISDKEVAIIKPSLVKSQGYLNRFFTNESWDEWSNHKTSLGRVVSLYCDYASQAFPKQPELFMKRLNKGLVERANQEAQAVLKAINGLYLNPNHIASDLISDLTLQAQHSNGFEYQVFGRLDLSDIPSMGDIDKDESPIE
jgi:hypothetical protein